MCRLRQVNIRYTICGHEVPQPDMVVPCEDTRCIFSPNHGPSCSASTCRKTCWQRYQYPQQYTPHINSICPRCTQSG